MDALRDSRRDMFCLVVEGERVHVSLSSPVVRESEVIRMVIRRGEGSLMVPGWKQHVFSALRCIDGGLALAFNAELAPCIAVCSFLLLDSGWVSRILPRIWGRDLEESQVIVIRGVHALMMGGYTAEARTYLDEIRLPRFLLDGFPCSLTCFRRRIRSARRVEHYKLVFHRPRCVCDECSAFQARRLRQFFYNPLYDRYPEPYPTPYFGSIRGFRMIERRRANWDIGPY